MRNVILLVFFTLQAGVLPGLSAAAREAPDRPNVLLFLVDDMGIQDTSEPFLHDDEGRPVVTALNQRYRTPNIEALARQGLTFTQAYACSVCTPTRVSIMTGLNAARHRVTTWTHPDTPQDTGSNQVRHLVSPDWRMAGMDPSDRPLPRLLKDAGYRTIHAGKAHFGANSSFAGNPCTLGFDVNIGGHGAGGPGSYHGTNRFSAAWRNGGHMWDVPGLEKYHGQDIFLTEALTREMGASIEQAVQEKKPFFAYMAHYAVHAPFEVDDRFAAGYPGLKGKDLAFATMVEGMDKSLGDLMATLEGLGVAEKTLVIFFSDNGSDGPANLPLRGKKGMRYDGGLRVPLIAAWARPDPAHPLQQRLAIPAGEIEDDVVVCEDLFATVAAVAGVAVQHPVDGRDLSPYLRGIPGTHRPPIHLVHFPHGHNHDHFTAYRQGPWKLIHSYGPGQWELFNLASDPYEAENMVASQPRLARDLAGAMLKRLQDYRGQFPVNRETGAAVLPDFAPLDLARDQAAALDAPSPLSGDDLDLSARVQPVTPDNIFRDPEWFNWCNSIIRADDGAYHMFYARWPRSFGFYSWLTHSEIARAVSDHPAGPYTHVETVIGSRGTQGWNQITAHNVKVEKFGDRYYLYLIGTNDGGRDLPEAELETIARRGYSHPHWGVLRNNQRTGVAVADRLQGPWRVSAQPVVEPGGPVSGVSVNPDVWRGHDGRYYMIFKGDYPGVRIAQALAISDGPEGPFRVQPTMVFDALRTEDASTWWDPAREIRYALFHDMHGFGMIASSDDVRWQRARHYRAIGKTIRRAGGGVIKPQRYERPFVYTEAGIPRVLGSAVKQDDDAYIVLVPLTPPPATP